ncbi:MAG: hypothetical protein IT210_00325 [Armatimonadetes bacterium]|nr:hypothetical protein [Armatimonadota bacterium]
MIIEDPRSDELIPPQDIILIYRCGHKAVLSGNTEILCPEECLLCKEAKQRWRGITEEEAQASIASIIADWQAQGMPVSTDVLAERILHLINYVAVS